MEEMKVEAYVQKYCHNKWSEWGERKKKFKRKFEQDAYYDRTVYFDEENNIRIVDEYYLGD